MKPIKPAQGTPPPPDSLAARHVLPFCQTRQIGRQCYTLAERTTSTNRDARILGENGGPHGAVVIADTQTAGRGRHQRAWISPQGVGLYVSVLLRPHIPIEQAPLLGIAAAVAAARAMEASTHLSPRIKWPNDILVQDGKVAGILAESHLQPDGSFFVVIGLGVNVNTPQDLLPQRPRFPATSLLREQGHPVSRPQLLAQWLTQLERLATALDEQAPDSILHAWQQLAYRNGEMVCVQEARHQTCGTLLGIDPDGALLLRTPSGQVHHIRSGDLRSPQPRMAQR